MCLIYRYHTNHVYRLLSTENFRQLSRSATTVMTTRLRARTIRNTETPTHSHLITLYIFERSKCDESTRGPLHKCIYIYRSCTFININKVSVIARMDNSVAYTCVSKRQLAFSKSFLESSRSLPINLWDKNLCTFVQDWRRALSCLRNLQKKAAFLEMTRSAQKCIMHEK